MKLYFIPFACSLATRIAIAESGLDADFVRVTPGRPLADGRDFGAISPMGYVPALETRAGLILTEGPAVLTYLADLAAEGVLAPPPFSDARHAMHMWLNFVATEIHKAVFAPLMSASSTEGARAWARAGVDKRFTCLSDHLSDRAFLLGTFSVADAYLLAVLNWCEHAGVAIAEWPVLLAWRTKLRARPSVTAAMAEEMPLLRAA